MQKDHDTAGRALRPYVREMGGDAYLCIPPNVDPRAWPELLAEIAAACWCRAAGGRREYPNAVQGPHSARRRSPRHMH